MAVTFLKGCTIALKDLGLLGGVSLYVYAAIALMSACLELRFLSKAMELYEQIQYIPIYQSAVLFSNILSGAIIMNERRLYTFSEFLMVVLGGSVALTGVWVIVKKPTHSADAAGADKTAATPSTVIPTTINNGLEVDEDTSRSLRSLAYGVCSCEHENMSIKRQVGGFHRKPVQDRVEIRTTVYLVTKIISIAVHQREREQLDAQQEDHTWRQVVSTSAAARAQSLGVGMI